MLLFFPTEIAFVVCRSSINFHTACNHIICIAKLYNKAYVLFLFLHITFVLR